jgi:GH25 family lysozyme M1 (1,4-beta-N-acetylmuramidase)
MGFTEGLGDLAMLRGFDLSAYQGAEDMAGMKKLYGLSFIAVKATQGETYLDQQFRTYWPAIAAAGMVRMAYSYGSPDADPTDDARVFVDYVAPSLPTDLLCLDLESSTLSGVATAAWACAWADSVRANAPGYVPGVYCGGYMDQSAYAHLKEHFGWWWYPRWPSTAVTTTWPSAFTPSLPSPNVWGGPPKFWQWTDRFSDLGELHDGDVFNGTEAELRALNGAPTTTKVDEMEIWKDSRGYVLVGGGRPLLLTSAMLAAAHGATPPFTERTVPDILRNAVQGDGVAVDETAELWKDPTGYVALVGLGEIRHVPTATELTELAAHYPTVLVSQHLREWVESGVQHPVDPGTLAGQIAALLHPTADVDPVAFAAALAPLMKFGATVDEVRALLASLHLDLT